MNRPSIAPLKTALSGYKKPDFLIEGEQALVQGIISKAIYWKGVVVLLLALFLLYPAFNLGLFLLLVAGVMIFVSALTERYLILILTDKRVIIRAGIMYVELIEIRHSQVESVELSSTMIGQLFGYASVVISGTGRRTVMVPFIKNALEFRQAIEQRLLERDDANSGR